MTTTQQEERVLELLIAQIQQVPAEEIREVNVRKVNESYSVPIAGGYLATIGASENIYTFNGQEKIEEVFSIEIDSPDRESVFYRSYSDNFQEQKEWCLNLRETYLTLQRRYCSHQKIFPMTDKLDKDQIKLNALEKALLSK